mmetsp:Transcript_71159/g.166592  ORF Transcript_71159/g.166592 Transcript_71159/m.166592 type:complete len:234 (+) Transcript_71159:372-1073(+)
MFCCFVESLRGEASGSKSTKSSRYLCHRLRLEATLQTFCVANCCGNTTSDPNEFANQNFAVLCVSLVPKLLSARYPKSCKKLLHSSRSSLASYLNGFASSTCPLPSAFRIALTALKLLVWDTNSMTRTPRCRKRLMTPRFLAEVHRPTDAPSSATSCRTSKNPQSDASSTMYLFFLDAASFLQALTMASSLASPRFLGFLSTGWNRTSFRLKREAHVFVRSKPGAAKTLVRTL